MSKQHQVVIKFTGNTTQAEAAMRKLKTEMSAVGAEVTKVDNTVKKVGKGFENVSQVTLKSTASLTDLKHALRGASLGIVDAGATLDRYKIKTTDLHTKTISASEAAKKAAIEQARYNKLMAQGAIDAQRLAAATARAATAASATANSNALAAIRQSNASTVGVGATARASATIANAGLSTQAAALRLQSQQAAAAAAAAARLQRQQDMQAASAARAAQHASALAIAQARQQAAADRAALSAQRLADANNRAGRSSHDAGGMHGLSAKHVLTYSAAYMAASAAIIGFLSAVASVPQLGMKLQATESGLLGVYKNQALVNEQLGFLSRLADEAGVKVTTLRDAYTKFTASAIKAGTTVEDAQKQFENYTKTARALNLNDQDFQGMLTAIQQILSKGRIMSEELQGQLGEHIPAAVAIMAKSIKNADGTIGVTTMQLRKMMEQGQLTSLEMQRFSDVLFNEFSQGYAASIDNLSAETARFSNAWDEVATTIFKATESIMADVVGLSTGALHQLNATLQITSDHITALDGKQIRFSIEPKVIEDLNLLERSLVNIESFLDQSAAGWASAFSKWEGSFYRLKASMDFGLDEAILGNTADQFRDYEKVVENANQANKALLEGFTVLRKGTEAQAVTLKDELAVALRNYNQQSAEMLRQIEQQERTISNLNKSGQSSKGETARLAESKKSYEAIMQVIANYADLFVRTNQKIGEASNAAKAALDGEAKVAADGVRAAEAETSAKKAATEATQTKVEIDRKHADTLRKSVETQLEANLALKGGSAAVEYYKLRLEGLTAAEAKAAIGKQAQVKAEEELKKLRGEQTSSSENILDKYKQELETSGVLFTDNFTEAESAAQRAIGYAETFEAKLKAAGEAFKNVTSEVTSAVAPTLATSAAAGSYKKGTYSTLNPLAADFGNLPVQGRISSEYGMRTHPVTGQLKAHQGVDIAAPAGTPIKAPKAGVVAFMGKLGGYGNAIIIQHDEGVQSLYGHLQSFEKDLAVGKSVMPNQTIGGVGSTGVSTGNHLHYELRKTTDKALANTKALATATDEVTKATGRTVTVTGEYGGKLAEANLSQEELWLQLSSLKLQNAANGLSTEAARQRRSYESSGLALREQELTAQGITGQLQAQVIASEQMRDLAQVENDLLKQREAIQNPGIAGDFRRSLSDTTLSKAQIEELTGNKLQIEFDKVMRELDGRAEQATMTAEAYKQLTLARDGFTQAQINGQMAWEREVLNLEDVAEANSRLAQSFEADLASALKSGELNFSSFADTVLAEVQRLYVIKPIMELLFGAGGGGQGGLFGGLTSFLFGFADGGAFNYNGMQTYSNGGAFHNSVLTKPTQFFANGGLAVAGEAGAEAVMPLTRIGGKLGVQAVGGAANVTVQNRIEIINNGAPAKVAKQEQTTDSSGNPLTRIFLEVESQLADKISKRTGPLYGALRQSNEGNYA